MTVFSTSGWAWLLSVKGEKIIEHRMNWSVFLSVCFLFCFFFKLTWDITNKKDASNKVLLFVIVWEMPCTCRKDCDSCLCSCSVCNSECMRKNLIKNCRQHNPVLLAFRKSNTMMESLQGCRPSKGDYAWLVAFPAKSSWSVFIRQSLYACAVASYKWWSVTAPEKLLHSIVSIIHIFNSP